MTSAWISLLAFTFLCSLVTIEGSYRLVWITSGDSHSGSSQWVTFQLINDEGKTTKIFYPNEYFWRGRYNSAHLDGPSIGKIIQVIVGVQNWGPAAHQDDWNGWVVDITDLDTKKVYEFRPGWIDTNRRVVFAVKEVPCKDKTDNPKEWCRVMGSSCGTAAGDDDAFAMAKTDHTICFKSCKFCVA